ncbi:MAG: MucR family transcriptional regulator [Hyphomonadaceae bacterium]|nr:MucR family transcriptional regulator [Hyphomonadaceae bacterium]
MTVAMVNRSEIVAMTAEIVSAYVGANELQPSELSGLIETVSSALVSISSRTETGQSNELSPAVPVKKSVTPDFIICLEDGKKFKSLRRHLRTKYGMSPEQYRAKWGLPSDYPMVAPNYTKARSDLAKRMRLGYNRRG